MGIFAQHAPSYLEAGLPAFPVETRTKKPRVKNWQRAGRPATAAWIDRFGYADGLGICVGQSTGIVEVDVDLAGDAVLAAAMERFGDTPISLRTASGKSKLWYRHNGEGRHIRVPGNLPIDVLGEGFTIAPPSRRADLGTSYRFLTGGLDLIGELPGIRADALDAIGRKRAPETVVSGMRNNALYTFCMTEARFCDDVETLIDVAQTWNAATPEPLGSGEVEATARSAWRYETEGRNFVGLKCPQVTIGDKIMDDLRDVPDAFWLLHLFRRYHGNRESFAVSPSAMSRAKNPPWCRERIERARDILVDRGYLGVSRSPNARARRSGLYFLTMLDSSNNHYTPFPPSSELGRAA
ncbi:MAG: bifunctional DNA primase/polymerase [Pseudomonadota bacterium]